MSSSKPWLKYRKSTGYTVSFPTVPSLTVQPSEVSLYQEKMAHDVLTMKFERSSQTWYALLKTGTPVVFSWRQSGRNTVWTGYVTHVSRSAAGQQVREMKVSCIGASYVLKARASRVWRKKTVTDVARTIAKEFGLKFVGESSTRQFEQLSMTGQTYWQFLKQQAERIGYILTVQNTTMYMYPLEKFINDSAANAPILGIDYPATASNTKGFDKTLDYFNVLQGDYFDSDEALYTNKIVSGVNPLSSKPLSAKTSPDKGAATRNAVPRPIFEDYSNEVVVDSRTSKQASEALALGAKFAFPAEGRGQGDPRLAPYRAVLIVGMGTSVDGFWAVSKVHHLLTIEGRYEVDFKLVTDGIGENSSSPFRKAESLAQGRINVDAAVLFALKNVSLKSPSSLVSKSAVINELYQGFGAETRYWKES